jgi:SAM-dependent methyltransferase
MLGTELLDDPHADPALVRAELRDIERLNTMFGGTKAVLDALQPILIAAGKRETGNGKRWTLLDVGTGAGDIPRAVQRIAEHYGIDLDLVGVERIRAAAGLARAAGVTTIIADGAALPLAPRSVDVVLASQVLHHVPREVGVRWIAALDRIARRAVVLADLRRSRLAMAGMWAVSFPLGLPRQTRRDAVLSLRRGFTRAELASMVRDAGVVADVRYAPIARVVAVWEPSAVSHQASVLMADG